MKYATAFLIGATAITILLPGIQSYAQTNSAVKVIRPEPALPPSGSQIKLTDGLPQDARSGSLAPGQLYLSGPNSEDRTWLLPVTEESRIVEDDRDPASENPADAKPQPGRQRHERPRYSDTASKSQGHILVRTTRVYPQPDIRRALTREEQFALTDSRTTHRIRTTLRADIKNVDFTETPLRDVIARLKQELGIPIQLDMKALEDAGVDRDTPVTKDLSGISLRSALRLLLGDIDLTYLIKDEVLLITTKDKAGENLFIRCYAMPPWTPVDSSLIDALQNTVGGPGAWSDGGGNGTVRPGPSRSNSLIVSQTEEVHGEIVEFLDIWMGDDLAPRSEDQPSLPKAMPTRLYRVYDESLLQDLPGKLTQLCNDALGDRGDPGAKIGVLGNRIVVQSRNRAFHVYAGELIQALNGADSTTTEFLFDTAPIESWLNAHQNHFWNGMGGGMGGGGMGGGGGGMFAIPPEPSH
jgi:hypothetical protein